MAETTKVKKGDHIQMEASLAGDDFSWAPGQVLRVGKDIEEDFANALITDPADAVRAHPIDADTAKRLLDEQQVSEDEALTMANEIPPPPREERGFVDDGREATPPSPEPAAEDDGEEGTVETRDQPPQGEQATSPQAESRETATPKRERRKVKPPEAKPPATEDEES